MKATQAVSPLYIFGYGSLLWRPGDLLGSFPSYLCTAYNWKRLFVQRSCDHRGLPEYPGLVATMVDDEDLQAVLPDLSWTISCINNTLTNSKGSECVGLVWLIPEDSREELLKELDYREKGGYTRHSIKVRLHQQTPFHSVDELTEAIVYTGHISNPLFDFKPLNLGSNYYLQTYGRHDISFEVSTNVPRPQNPGANIIAASCGPSGTNIEYLFGLMKFIKENGLEDEYLDHLCYDVLLRVGTWRTKYIRQKYLFQQFSTRISYLPKSESITSQTVFFTSTGNHNSISNRMRILGWGSNEFQQLKPWRYFHKTNEILLKKQSTPISLNLEDKILTSSAIEALSTAITNNHPQIENLLIDNPIELHDFCLKTDNTTFSQEDNMKIISYSLLSSSSSSSSSIYYKNSSCLLTNKKQIQYPKLQLIPLSCNSNNNTTISSSVTESSSSSTTTTTASSDSIENNKLSDCNIFNEHVIAGGRWSGHLVGTKLVMWGSISSLEKLFDFDFHTNSTIDETQHDKLKDIHNSNSSSIESMDPFIKVEIDGVAGCSIGHDHILLLSTCHNIIVGLGDNSHGQCLTPASLPFLAPYNPDNYVTSTNNATMTESILKLSTGLKHSAAVTTCGKLYTWGQNLHKQCLDNIYSTTSSNPSINILPSSNLNSMNKITNHGVGVWQPFDNAKIIDVSCGAKHTCVIDEWGRVWTFGNNQYGALGREIVISSNLTDKINPQTKQTLSSDSRHVKKDNQPTLIDIKHSHLQNGIRWQRVTCGWHHTLIRGIRIDGSIVVVGFGRCDMKQFPIDHYMDTTSTIDIDQSRDNSNRNIDSNCNVIFTPTQLSPLPNGAEIAEIWSGSEFTVAVDDAGFIWASGWNEHYNAGGGTSNCTPTTTNSNSNHSDQELRKPNLWVSSWNPIMTDNTNQTNVMHIVKNSMHQVRVRAIWEGSVAAGGGHVICLV